MVGFGRSYTGDLVNTKSMSTAPPLRSVDFGAFVDVGADGRSGDEIYLTISAGYGACLRWPSLIRYGPKTTGSRTFSIAT